MTEKIDAYPLLWPIGWPRCQTPEYSRFQTSLAEARSGLKRELDLLGARDVVINSNALLLRNGEIAGRQPRLSDTGVAVYFTLKGEQRCIPCDRWVLLEENIQAIRKTIEALRGIERWGTPGVVAAAFHGFQALPEGGNVSWWRVLEVAPDASEMEIEAAYRRLAKKHHPDTGGSAEQFAAVHGAYQQAKRKTA
jgi:DnaJ-domain-containing protein 1